MSLQSKFRTFHQSIQLRRFTEDKTLTQKSEAVLARLRDKSPQRFTSFHQGSYEMGTGVKPIDGDYDIDVGVVFDIADLNKVDARTAKRWVYDAVQSHTKDVTWKEPCVTVQYRSGNEPVYHVDLAIYGLVNGQLYLARGKEHAADPRWERSDPRGLIKAIDSKFTGEDAAQFRRVVQYLKRWKDFSFPSDGHAAPVGIGLTLLAYKSFSVSRSGADYDDLTALRNFVSSIRSSFIPKGAAYRISANVPVEPRDDVFARMTDQQCTEFKGRIDKLKEQLDEADRTKTAAPLRRVFGNEFPE